MENHLPENVWLTTCNIAKKILSPPLLKEYGYIYSRDIFRPFFLSFFFSSSWWCAMWNTVSLVCEKQWHRCSIIKPHQSLPAGVWNVQCSSTVQHVLGAVWERVAAGQTCVFSSSLCLKWVVLIDSCCFDDRRGCSLQRHPRSSQSPLRTQT